MSSAVSRPAYRYQPLVHPRSLRILVIEPGPYDDLLSCKLLRTTLDTCPPFYALSYAWQEHRTATALRETHAQDMTDEKWQCISVSAPSWLDITQNLMGTLWQPPSLLDYEGSEDKMDVNINLVAALKWARNPSAYLTYIWADMVCINQADHDEKIAQIQIMRDIFQKADQVIIWLGEALERDKLVFEHLEDYAEVVRPWDRGMPILHEPARVRSAEYAKEKGIPQLTDSAAMAWHDFFSRAWFQRKWCIQELCVASEDNPPEVWCGGYRCNWRDVGLIAQWMRKSGYASHTSEFNELWTDWLAAMRDNFERRNINTDEGIASNCLLSLLYRTGQFRASVAHDKLYALFGLASDFRDSSGTLLLVPTYKKPVVDIMLDLARVLIAKDGMLTPLQYTNTNLRTTPGLPSWCPDWLCSSGGTMPNGGYYPYPHCPWQACKNFTTDLGVVSDPCLLRVQAIQVDDIHHKFREFLPAGKSSTPSDAIAPTIKDTWQEILAMSKEYNLADSPENLFDNYWKTLTTKTKFVPKMSQGHQPCHAADFWSKLYEGTNERAPEIRGAHPNCPKGELRWYRHRVNLNSTGRNFIVTTAGRMGWAPSSSEEGDKIYILKGGCVPFILRAQPGERGASTSRYALFGECYVHGIMNGEWFDQIEDESTLAWTQIDLM